MGSRPWRPVPWGVVGKSGAVTSRALYRFERTGWRRGADLNRRDPSFSCMLSRIDAHFPSPRENRRLPHHARAVSRAPLPSPLGDQLVVLRLAVGEVKHSLLVSSARSRSQRATISSSPMPAACAMISPEGAMMALPAIRSSPPRAALGDADDEGAVLIGAGLHDEMAVESRQGCRARHPAGRAPACCSRAAPARRPAAPSPGRSRASAGRCRCTCRRARRRRGRPGSPRLPTSK